MEVDVPWLTAKHLVIKDEDWLNADFAVSEANVGSEVPDLPTSHLAFEGSFWENQALELFIDTDSDDVKRMLPEVFVEAVVTAAHAGDRLKLDGLLRHCTDSAYRCFIAVWRRLDAASVDVRQSIVRAWAASPRSGIPIHNSLVFLAACSLGLHECLTAMAPFLCEAAIDLGRSTGVRWPVICEWYRQWDQIRARNGPHVPLVLPADWQTCVIAACRNHRKRGTAAQSVLTKYGYGAYLEFPALWANCRLGENHDTKMTLLNAYRNFREELDRHGYPPSPATNTAMFLAAAELGLSRIAVNLYTIAKPYLTLSHLLRATDLALAAGKENLACRLKREMERMFDVQTLESIQ